ncbi:MAG: putative Holliday junction resolvase [Paenibacillus sp.]|jgi:putative Holliday junction resolvase|nr:putative Holliday junction resolvase [Paenibacillus sp.]
MRYGRWKTASIGFRAILEIGTISSYSVVLHGHKKRLATGEKQDMTRTMGLDYGDKTIGVAISDAFGWTAQGVETIRRRKPEDDLARLRQLAAEYEVSGIVVGLPKNMNNTIGPRGELCIAFSDSLREALQLPVTMWDERLSTVSAQRTLLEADLSRNKRKQVVDKMAAVFILQNYLDFQSKK